MNSTFSVYEGNCILIDGKPLVIIVGRPTQVGFRTEIFIFVRNPDNDFYFRSLYTREYEDTEIPLKIDMGFMINQSVQAATSMLNNHLSNQYKKTKDMNFLVQNYSLTLTDNIRLFSLFHDDRYYEKLQFIYGKTRSDKLKRIMNRMWDAPKIGISNE